MPTDLRYEAGSYRDREGRVFYDEAGEVRRAVSARALAEFHAVNSNEFFRQGMAEGRIVRTVQTESLPDELGLPAGEWAGVLWHETIPFVSYPYEWTFGMLQDAALLHLALLEAALASGFTIKDGTAYNIQFIGARP